MRVLLLSEKQPGQDARKRYFCLNRTFNLVRSQASGANINLLFAAVNDCIDLLYIRLPAAVASSVRVGYSDAESNALSTDITFCHDLHLPMFDQKDPNYG